MLPGVKIILLFDGEKNPLRFVSVVVICQRRITNMDLLFIHIFTNLRSMVLDKFLCGIDHCRVLVTFLGLDEECRRKLFEQKVSSFTSSLKAPIFVMCEDG